MAKSKRRTIRNANSANHRKRRDKADFNRHKDGYFRGRNPRAARRAVPILSISNVPNDVLDAIDKLAASQDRSRSSFIRRELRHIVAVYRARAA
jgi:hypothetical protein